MEHYQIVMATSPEAMEKHVELLILDGWKPIGGLTIAEGPNEQMVFHQALWQEPDKED